MWRDHTLILKKSGEVLGCGRNEEGQLGTGDKRNRTKMELLMKDEQIKTICCGAKHTFLKGKRRTVGFWVK